MICSRNNLFIYPSAYRYYLLFAPYDVLEACLRVCDETLTKIINWLPIYAKNPQINIKRFFLPLSDSYSRSKIGIGLLAKVKAFVNCGCV